MIVPHVVLLAAVFSPSPELARPAPPCDAAHVFALSRIATGGHRWDDVREIVADGTMTDSGAVGTVHVARELATGRSAFVESLAESRVAYLYDGRTKWEQDQGLGIHALDAPESAARAITDAYVDRNGFWKSPQDAARVDCLHDASENGKSFAVFRVTPRRGSAVEIWIDRSTHLIERTVVQLPTTASTKVYGDYREIGGVVLPFTIKQRFTDADGNPAYTSQSIRTYRLLRTVRAEDFRRPPDPTNGRVLGGASFTKIPFSVDKGVIVFSASLNGHGPFAFVFDPGAQGVLTSTVAHPLRLKVGTMTNVRRLRVGEGEIDNIALSVYGGRATDLFPERDPRKAPIAGALGPELLDRFAVRLDYDARTMTLTPLEGFRYHGTGVAQHFTLQEDDDIPLIPAVIDGHAGRIEYDVRAPSSLMVFRPFLRETGLSNVYRTARGTVATLAVGGVVLHGVPTQFAAQRSGKFASRTEAGLSGYRVLSQFTTTLDYRRAMIWFEPLSPAHRHAIGAASI
jgi:hypothetical protein